MLSVSPENLREPPPGIDADWAQVNPPLQSAIREAVIGAKWPIYLFGDQGRGKTSAMASLYRKVINSSKWLDLQQFVRLVQRARTSDDGKVYDFSFSNYGASESDLYRKFVVDPQVVFVDDVGIRSASESVFEIVYEIVNRRGRRPAIYTSNVDPQRLRAIYDDRVASRMLAGTIIEVTGADRRIAGTQVIRA